MRIALVNPPWMYKRLYTHSLYPPYGLLMIGTMLAEDGHDVRIFDCNADELDEPALFEAVASWRPEAVGVTVFTDTFAFLERFGPWMRKELPGRPLILGGALMSGAPEVVMRSCGADVGVIGEGFISATNLFRALEQGESLSTVPGLIVRAENDELHRTGPTPVWDKLDDLPIPDWELLPVRKYIAGGPSPYFSKRRLQHYLSIITTLGCPWSCSFCQVPSLFEGVRRRSPASVAAEVKGYVDRYGIESMYFRDDILFRPGRIADALAEAVPDLQWSALLRADMITPSRVRRMRAGGCREIRVGFESGDDLVLDRANKKTAVADNVRCIEVCHAENVAVSGFLIVGLPGETEASLAATLRFVEETGARVSVHFPLPLPGTELFRQGLRDGLIPDQAALLRRFSEPQLPGAVLQPPPVDYCGLPDDVLVGWATRIAEVGRRGVDADEAAAGAADHADCPF